MSSSSRAGQHAEHAPARHRPGTARAALAHRPFRILWTGLLLSNIGTWMQNYTLPAYALARFGSATFVGVLVFAQLGPVLILSPVAGVIADRVDRRWWIIAMQSEQLVFSLVLAALVRGTPSMLLLFCTQTTIGIGNALNAPAWQSLVPALVGHEDLPGAIALNSAQLNGTRVIGPTLAGIAFPLLGAAWVFTINAATYVFVIAALLTITVPRVVRKADEPSGWRNLLVGFRVARNDRLVGRVLVTMTLFSFLSLPFLGQFSVLAKRNFGLQPRSLGAGLLYATFGLGATVGALAIGTVLAGADKRVLAKRCLLWFALFLALFAVAGGPLLAFPFGFALGIAYFGFATSLTTVLQANIADDVRGRVMALWFMSFGGTVPLGNLVAGPIIDRIGVTPVVLFGAVAAVALWLVLDLDPERGYEPAFDAALDAAEA